MNRLISQLTVDLKQERLDFGVSCGLLCLHFLIQPVKHKMAISATE